MKQNVLLQADKLIHFFPSIVLCHAQKCTQLDTGIAGKVVQYIYIMRRRARYAQGTQITK